MTKLERIKQLAAQYRFCAYNNQFIKSFPETVEDIQCIAECLEKADKYRWHDLRKNPNDLPERCGFYIACVEHPTNHTRNTREVQLYNIVNGECVWRKNNRFLLEKSVIAWREIESFEEEEE